MRFFDQFKWKLNKRETIDLPADSAYIDNHSHSLNILMVEFNAPIRMFRILSSMIEGRLRYHSSRKKSSGLSILLNDDLLYIIWGMI